MNRPRMRTAPQAIKELKEIDPETAFTLRALRRMMNNGEIPVINVQSKRLVNLDLLLEILSCENVKQPETEQEYGKIRRIVP